ncbi:MAG: retropepsin-like aspartic protease family protein [Rubrivivax sp.]|nr:retroviral-like aspartic protease family protein [Rubrivivax sp.]
MNAPSPRELPAWIKHTTVWLLLAAGLFVAVQAWQRERAAPRFAVDGSGRIVIERSDDGHFHWAGRLNDQTVEFLVDTGATTTAIPEALAQQLGLVTAGSVRGQTAGGTVTGRVVVADLVLQGGVVAERLRIVALPDLGQPLLGMDVLGRLRWQQDGGVLRIEGGSGRR